MDTLKLIVIAGIMGLMLVIWKQVVKAWYWSKYNELNKYREELEEVATKMYRMDNGDDPFVGPVYDELSDRRDWINKRIQLLNDRLEGDSPA